MAEKQIWIQELVAKLVIPGREKPITMTGLRLIFDKLGIETEIKGKPGERRRAYVTPAQARLVEEEFRRIHWKKFKGVAE